MKALRIDTEILDWEGNPIPWESEPDGTPRPGTPNTTLRRVLLRYLRLERHMVHLTEADRDVVYSLGAKIGAAQGQVELDAEQMAVLEKIVKPGKIGGGESQVPEQYPFSVEARVATIRLVAQAQDVSSLPRMEAKEEFLVKELRATSTR